MVAKPMVTITIMAITTTVVILLVIITGESGLFTMVLRMIVALAPQEFTA